VAYQVTIAAVGDLTQPRSQPIEAVDGRYEAWEDREKITLEVEENEQLSSVLERAGREFQVPLGPSGRYHYLFQIAFFEEGEPGGFRDALSALTLVDDDGRAIWNVHDFELVPYDQIVRSASGSARTGSCWASRQILRAWLRLGIVQKHGTPLRAAELTWQPTPGPLLSGCSRSGYGNRRRTSRRVV
jgi:hypothetical protein